MGFLGCGLVPDLVRSLTKQNGLWPPSGTTDFQSVVWPTDWKSIVRLADGLEFGGTKNDPTEGEAPKVVLGTGFSYWGNRPTKTPIPLLTPAGASTVAIIT